MFHLVNPSDAPKKGRRRNPELLIVNPYKLGDKKRRKKMAKRKKSRKKSRRKNPLSRRRRNPGVVDTVKDLLEVEDLKTVALGVLGGGTALVLGSLAIGDKLGQSNVAKAGVAVASGLLGAIALNVAGDKLGKPALADAAKPVAQAAMMFGLFELARGPLEDTVAKARSAVGLADWELEHGAGLGAWQDETKGWKQLMAGNAGGFGENTVTVDPVDVPTLSGSYEQLGDLMGQQRLGSFESEFGEFVAEGSMGLLSQQETERSAASQGLAMNTLPGAGRPGLGNFTDPDWFQRPNWS
jgi:hypothetical protein